VGGLASVVVAFQLSPNVTKVHVPLVQPVPFSHQDHAGSFGIACRYCHTSVETSSFAGLPPAETCMSCHSQIWADNPLLEPIRESFRSGQPVRWNRVYDMPDYAYFRHNLHVNKGIGCSTCHGRVDQMPLTWKEHALRMDWCLDCHRNPQRFVRPQSEIYNMAWEPPANQAEVGPALARKSGLRSEGLMDCYVCHR
jgi:hypothetical protein